MGTQMLNKMYKRFRRRIPVTDKDGDGTQMKFETTSSQQAILAALCHCYNDFDGADTEDAFLQGRDGG